jgi:hypothetical protein
MFSSLLNSAEVRLLQATDTYSSFEPIKVLYRTFRLPREERLYAMKRINPDSFSTCSQNDDKNALCSLI